MMAYSILDDDADMPAAEPFAELSGIYVRAGRRTLLHNISLTVMPEEHVVLLGPNGAGKSRLLQLLSADIRPSLPEPGEVIPVCRLFGEDPAPLSFIRERTGVVSTVLEYEFLLRYSGILARDVILTGGGRLSACDTVSPYEKQLLSLQNKFDISDDILSRPLSMLSAGERRICMLMRAMIRSPQMLLLDEPFSGLDINSRGRLFSVLANLAGNCSVVTITHAPEDIYPYTSKVIVLSNGKIIAHGHKNIVMEATDFSNVYGTSAGIYRSGEVYQWLR